MSLNPPETLQRVRMSWDDYLALPHPPIAEWIDGEVLVNAPMSPAHSDASFGLRLVLRQALPGLFVYQEVGVRVPGNRIRVPDVMVVTERPDEKITDLAPLLVAEVLSRDTERIDLVDKPVDYAAAGIEHYWQLDPERRTLTTLRLVGGTVDRTWQPTHLLDPRNATAVVTLGDHGSVRLDLDEVLAG